MQFAEIFKVISIWNIFCICYLYLFLHLFFFAFVFNFIHGEINPHVLLNPWNIWDNLCLSQYLKTRFKNCQPNSTSKLANLWVLCIALFILVSPPPQVFLKPKNPRPNTHRVKAWSLYIQPFKKNYQTNIEYRKEQICTKGNIKTKTKTNNKNTKKEEKNPETKTWSLQSRPLLSSLSVSEMELELGLQRSCENLSLNKKYLFVYKNKFVHWYLFVRTKLWSVPCGGMVPRTWLSVWEPQYPPWITEILFCQTFSYLYLWMTPPCTLHNYYQNLVRFEDSLAGMCHILVSGRDG